MKKISKGILAGLMLGLGVAFTSVALLPPVAQASYTVTTETKTTVTWEMGNNAAIQVVGTGIAPQGYAGPRANAMARRAAIVDGYRLIAETIQGVAVNAETNMKDLMLASDVVNTRVSALVRGAVIVEEKALPDGVYTVTLSIPLYGNNGLAGIAVPQLQGYRAPSPDLNPYYPVAPAPQYGYGAPPYMAPQAPAAPAYPQAPAAPVMPNNQIQSRVDVTVPAPVPSAPSVQQPVAPSVPTMPAMPSAPAIVPAPAIPAAPAAPVAPVNGTTGLIINAQGLGLQGTFSPVIYDTNNQVIYGGSNYVGVAGDKAISMGMVEYSSSLARAQSSARAGAKPLIINAVGVSGGKNSVNTVNVIVSVEDGQRILAENAASGFLNNLNVVFVK